MMTSSNVSLQLPYTITVYGLTPYFRKYLNTTVPSNHEFKNVKIANSRNINPTKIKAHTIPRQPGGICGGRGTLYKTWLVLWSLFVVITILTWHAYELN